MSDAPHDAAASPCFFESIAPSGTSAIVLKKVRHSDLAHAKAPEANRAASLQHCPVACRNYPPVDAAKICCLRKLQNAQRHAL